MKNPWVKKEYVMEETGWSQRTLARRIEEGKFPSHDRKDGKKLIWRKTTIDRWLEAGKHLDR